MASVIGLNSQGNLNDITKDLPSLQFETALSDDEKTPYTLLRKRSHAITVTACAQATYFVAILNEARQKILQLKSPQQSKSSKFLQQTPLRNPLKIGIIGCGRIGSHLTNTLLTYADVLPEEIKISTRRPETLANFKNKAIECCYDNVKVASWAQLLFLCVLPSQMPTVAEDIKEAISPDCTLYTFLSSVPVPRLRRILEVKNIIRPEFVWGKHQNANQRKSGSAKTETNSIGSQISGPLSETPGSGAIMKAMPGAGAPGLDEWDCTKDVCITLEDQHHVELTCPLSNKNGTIISTKEKLAEMILYSFINMCTVEGLENEETLRVLNTIVLGLSPNQEYSAGFTAYDFTRRRMSFPVFNMAQVAAAKETPLTQTLIQNKQLRELFVKKYKSIFDKFYYWKGIKQVKQKSAET